MIAIRATGTGMTSLHLRIITTVGSLNALMQPLDAYSLLGVGSCTIDSSTGGACGLDLGSELDFTGLMERALEGNLK